MHTPPSWGGRVSRPSAASQLGRLLSVPYVAPRTSTPSMTDPAYPPARAAAAIVADFFARRVRTVPDEDTVTAVVDAAFWASLRREEGRPPKVSIAIVAPEDA